MASAGAETGRRSKRSAVARAAKRSRGRPNRSRRSQAERTAETRARLVAAVHACISELGLAGTTGSEIARRSGVTWGAVQHHYGGKDGILTAALEDSVARLAARLAGLDPHVALAERVDAFVARAWEHFASPEHRSTFEILLYFGSDAPAASRPWQRELMDAFDAVWTRVFSDVSLPRRRRAVLQRLTVATLSGIAALELIGPVQLQGQELALLRDTLLRELSAEGATLAKS